jgi:hypothetical protein
VRNQAHARAGICGARLPIGVLQVLVDDARLGEHLSAVDQHRDQARGIEREEFGLELIEAPQVEVVAGPGQPLLGQADAHLLAAGRVRAVIELDRCCCPERRASSGFPADLRLFLSEVKRVRDEWHLLKDKRLK